MKEIRAAVEKWASIVSMNPEEYNELLEELGYQVKVMPEKKGGTVKWSLTEKGFKRMRMSRNPFKKEILWDLDTHFQVHKLIGKKKQIYMFCDECDAYLNTQPGFNFGLKKFACERCGHVNDIVCNTETLKEVIEAEREFMDDMMHHKACNDVMQECPKCGKVAKGIDEIITLFGFQKTECDLQPYTLCKECRKKPI